MESDTIEIEERPPAPLRETDQVDLQGVPWEDDGRALREDLKSCNDLATLRIWAADHNILLREYRGTAFKQLYESGQGLEILLEALEDSALNCTDNLDYLLRFSAQKSLTPNNAEVLGQWMKRTIHLGQRSEDQICLLSEFALHLSTVNSDESSKHHFIASICEGLETSMVLGIQDLTLSTLATLLRAIARGSFTRASQDLGFRVIKALKPSQLDGLVHSISLFVQAEINALASIKSFERQKAELMSMVPRSFEILRDLPAIISSEVILDTSEALISDTKYLPGLNVPQIKLLDQWWSYLKQSNILERVDYHGRRDIDTRLERMLAGEQEIVVATYLRHLNDDAIAHFILVTDLGGRLHEGRAVDEFFRISESKEDRSPYISMFRAAHVYTELSNEQLKRTFKLLQMLQKSQSIVDIIAGLRKVNILIHRYVIIHTIKIGLHWWNHRAEAIFKAYRTLPLERCPELAERMINNPRRGPGKALCIYKSTHPLDAHSCRDRQHKIEARGRLLQRMALAYSTAKHLSSRMAFRYVYACYTLHMTGDLGHLEAGMVVALTRTGLVRPLQDGKWVSSERIRWILGLIEGCEGREVAEQVDRGIFEWRGLNITKIQRENLRERRISSLFGPEEAPGIFHVRLGWDPCDGHAGRMNYLPLEELVPP